MPTPQLDREQLAWTAGFFDGEGYIHFRTSEKSDNLMLAVDQVDTRVLERVRHNLRCGNINGPYKGYAAHHQDRYSFRIHGFEQVQQAVCFMWPWLGPVKRAQAKEALIGYLQRTPRKVRRIPVETKAAIRAAHQTGMKYKDIGAKFNLSSGSICKVVKYGY